MMDQQAVRRTLQELVKREDLKNKICVDCSNPNPQWASLSHAVFLCLQCAGVHRGFGVHISFVRSISMDTWQDDQVKRMQLGGNAPFRKFMEAYTPIDQGGYRDGLSAYDTYHCWAATQYREKLDTMVAGTDWSPSNPPPGFSIPGSGTASPGRPSSAQGLRKSRASARSATASSGLRPDSPSLSSLSPHASPDPGSPADPKVAKESYFASLGDVNASRPADLPPSQGGRYQGFGSTPPPPTVSQHPSMGTSSAAAPSLSELQENPMAALSKGWSLLSAAVVATSRVVSDNVIKPGVEKAMDPSLHASVKGYVSDAQKRAVVAGQAANHWSKHQLGVDVAEQVGGVVGAVKDTLGAGPAQSGYGALATEHEGERSALYHDDEDFFEEFVQSPPAQSHSQAKPDGATAGTTRRDDWDEWKDF